MTIRGYGAITDDNGLGWYPGQLVGQAVAKSVTPTIPDWVKYAGIALVAGIAIYGIYSMTR